MLWKLSSPSSFKFVISEVMVSLFGKYVVEEILFLSKV